MDVERGLGGLGREDGERGGGRAVVVRPGRRVMYARNRDMLVVILAVGESEYLVLFVLGVSKMS